MAYTEFARGSAQAVKRYSDRLMKETFGEMSITSLLGTDANACIQIQPDLDKNPGDNVVFDFLVQDRSAGVNGDSELEGFETSMTYYQDQLYINQKRQGHAFKGMSQQRTVHDLRKNGRASLAGWWAWFIEGGLFAHLAGVPGDGDETVIGALGADTGGTDFAGNVITTMDASHIVDGSAGDFDAGLIDQAVAKAKLATPRVAPIMVGGRETYVMYLHPASVWQMRENGSQWLTVQQYAGPRDQDNPIFSGALGVYNNVILRESKHVPSVSTLRHNLLLGRGAGAIAFGNAWEKNSRVGDGGGGSFFDWREQERDYGNKKGIGSVSILGFKRAIFNSKALGVISVRSTDAAP